MHITINKRLEKLPKRKTIKMLFSVIFWKKFSVKVLGFWDGIVNVF